MRKKKSGLEIIQSRPNIYIVTVCQNDKVIDQGSFYFVNEAFIYARDKRADGYATEQRTVPNPDFNGGYFLNPINSYHKKHKPSYNRKGWAQKVICLNTCVTYPTMKECENSVVISGYRIRNAIRKGVKIDGLQFQYA